MPSSDAGIPAADLDAILSRTRPLWSELNRGRVFITGGTGFFGCWMLESFLHANRELKLGAEMVVLTRDPAAFRQRWPRLACAASVRLHQGDVSDFAFPEGRFSHVVHAASELSLARPKDPVGLIDATLRGCRRVLAFAKERGVNKLLYTSSGAVYGPMFPGRMHLAEDDPISPAPLRPQGAYGEAKRLGELVCVLDGLEQGIEVKVARGFAFIGPYLRLDSPLAAASFLLSALRGEEIVIQGHGQTVRSYLYGADLAIWLWTILFKGQSARPYNLGSDAPVSIAELAGAVAACSASPGIRVLGQLAQGEIADVYLPDIQRARDELSLDVYTPLDEAVRRSLRFFSPSIRS